jgi:hypothetical protein
MRVSMKNNGPTRLYRFAGKLALVLAFVLLAGPAAYSQTATNGCDPLYMQALRGRGNLEAKREVSQNKNLIFKQDSVLEYSCFFSHITNMATQSRQLTTENMPISQQALDVVASTPVFNFLANSYGHVYLGDHYQTGSMSLPSGAYFCDAQAKMWEFARCINMHQYIDAESFFDFNWYMTNDPRQYPQDYAKCTPIAQATDLKSAFHGLQDTWLQTTSLLPDETQYGTDPVTTYLNLTRWDVGDDAGECGEPIPTGLQVIRKTTAVPEMICAKPGCTLVNQKCVKD